MPEQPIPHPWNPPQGTTHKFLSDHVNRLDRLRAAADRGNATLAEVARLIMHLRQ